jgi:hypothetical protein
MDIQTPCKDIPKDSVVFALGFLHLGENAGVIMPGQANIQIAQMLEQYADRFSLVLTQKAVSDALADPNALRDGTPVLQMHRHDPRVPVRTLAALRCALARFVEMPERIVLLAHPRHLRRALMDLEALYEGQIILLHPGETTHPNQHWSYPLRWTVKNALAWPVDYLLIQSIERPMLLAPLWWVMHTLGFRMECSKAVQLSQIASFSGE